MAPGCLDREALCRAAEEAIDELIERAVDDPVMLAQVLEPEPVAGSRVTRANR